MCLQNYLDKRRQRKQEARAERRLKHHLVSNRDQYQTLAPATRNSNIPVPHAAADRQTLGRIMTLEAKIDSASTLRPGAAVSGSHVTTASGLSPVSSQSHQPRVPSPVSPLTPPDTYNPRDYRRDIGGTPTSVCSDEVHTADPLCICPSCEDTREMMDYVSGRFNGTTAETVERRKAERKYWFNIFLDRARVEMHKAGHSGEV